MADIIKSGTNFDFLAKRKLAITFSSVLLLAIWALVPFRINLGVDFSGGTEIEVKFAEDVSAAEVRQKMGAAGFEDANVQQYGAKEERSFLVRVERVSILSPEQAQALQASLRESLASYGVQAIDLDENVGDKIDLRTEKPVPLDVLRSSVTKTGVVLATSGEVVRDLTRGGQPSYQILTQGLADKVSASLRAAFGDKVDVRRVEYVGPQVGAQLRNRGIMSVLLSMGAILLYVAFRFQPKYAPGGVIALFHDVTVVLGYYVVTGNEFNLTSIAVLLTIVGYSINDTIVIFDRVREVEARKTGKSLPTIINQALNETLSRTIITSGVTALSLIGLLVFGGGTTLFDFAAAMLVGLVSGTYSTIYIASPFAVWIDEWMVKRQAAAVAAGRKAPPAARAGKSPSKKRASASADS